MIETIIGSLITGGLAFAGVLVTTSNANKKVVNDIKLEVAKNQAVTDCKIDELTREVREHNGFARRMPVVEEKIKVINHRIDDLENGGK
nr:MAG TPA: hypothetical protein [Caudoviricetes sp.]